MNRSFLRTAFVCTLCTFAFIAAVNRRFYFETPIHEQGDIAVNALQIERAKHGTEIYGNYSRFHFNHPGPAFFYVYALGEWVFKDTLGIVPSPHNAHSLAGLLLQCAFFGLALAIFRERLQAPLLIPLALLLAAVHFGLSDDAFTSVWPPHVLLMPFLCFFAACASVASGRGAHLPIAVLAGGFLVHGHVAQPLFVGVLFAMSYALLWMGARREAAARAPWRVFKGAHVAGLVLAALFLLPLIIDWLRWPQDNMALILQHLRTSSGEHKKPLKSLLYFLSFFSYRHDQGGYFQTLSPASARFLLSGAAWYAVWIVLGGLLAWRWKAIAPDPSGRRFANCAAFLWLVSALLCLEWGVMQTGPMEEFNGHFYFALLYVPLLLAAAAISRWAALRPAAQRIAGVALCAAASLVAMRNFAVAVPERDGTGLPMLAATQALLASDPHPSAPKILVFQHDDWPDVAAAALALDRSGVAFSVDPQWGFMFGRYRSLGAATPPSGIGKSTVWRFLRRPLKDEGRPFVHGMRVSFAPGSLDPAGAAIDCSKAGNLERFQVSGFTTPDKDFTYTDDPEAILQIAGPEAASDVVLTWRASAFLAPPKVPSQPMELWVNGERVGTAEIASAGFSDVRLSVPKAVWNAARPVCIAMLFPSARSPAQLGINGDPRAFGWAIRSITLRYAESQ